MEPDLGGLGAGQTKYFTLYYGVTHNAATAMEAVNDVEVEVYSLAKQPTAPWTASPPRQSWPSMGGALLNRSLLRKLRWPMLIAGIVIVVCGGGGALWVSRNGLPLMEPPEKGPGMWIRNDRPQTVKVRIVFPTSATITERIAPGAIRGYPTAVACDASLIEATEENGYILGRLDSGGCVEQTWVIAADGTTRFVPGYAEH